MILEFKTIGYDSTGYFSSVVECVMTVSPVLTWTVSLNPLNRPHCPEDETGETMARHGVEDEIYPINKG